MQICKENLCASTRTETFTRNHTLSSNTRIRNTYFPRPPRLWLLLFSNKLSPTSFDLKFKHEMQWWHWKHLLFHYNAFTLYRWQTPHNAVHAHEWFIDKSPPLPIIFSLVRRQQHRNSMRTCRMIATNWYPSCGIIILRLRNTIRWQMPTVYTRAITSFPGWFNCSVFQFDRFDGDAMWLGWFCVIAANSNA